MGIANTLYTLNSYTVDTFTDLVVSNVNFTLASFLAVNTSGSTATVDVAVTDASDTLLATIVSGKDVLADESFSLNIKSLNLPTSYKLRVKANIAGVDFLASGIVIT